jgi:lactoylglutathione lyase
VAVTIRRAVGADVEWLVDLLGDDETEPYLRPLTADDVRLEIERSEREPQRFGRFVVEVDGERAGVMGFEERSEKHRIAHLGGLAIHPGFRGRRVADDAARQLQRHLFLDLGYHRLELSCYGFNERAIRHSERVGFTREGVKRRAYFRHGEWQDAVEFALLREDLYDDGVAARFLHTMVRITDPAASRAFYEALGFTFERDMDIVRNGEKEATNYFFSLGDHDSVLELTFNHDGREYELGTGYGHIAVGVDDLDATLAQLAGQGIEPERPPYQVSEGGSFLCFVRDPDGYRLELIGRG